MKTRNRIPFVWLFLLSIYGCFQVTAVTSRIMPKLQRDKYIQNLEDIIQYSDEELEQKIPFIENPFFFEQPLLLKLRLPGGISDMDVLRYFGAILVDEYSSVMVIGSGGAVTLKNGESYRAGKTITRTLPELGNLKAKVTISKITRSQLVLRLNNTEYSVDLSK